MDNGQISLIESPESPRIKSPSEGYSAKEQELIHQLVQARLGKKNAIEFEPLEDYVVPPEVFFSQLKKPAVSIRANRIWEGFSGMDSRNSLSLALYRAE